MSRKWALTANVYKKMTSHWQFLSENSVYMPFLPGKQARMWHFSSHNTKIYKLLPFPPPCTISANVTSRVWYVYTTTNTKSLSLFTPLTIHMGSIMFAQPNMAQHKYWFFFKFHNWYKVNTKDNNNKLRDNVGFGKYSFLLFLLITGVNHVPICFLLEYTRQKNV